MFGFSSGVMLAASDWLLLASAIVSSNQGSPLARFLLAVGFFFSVAVFWALDKVMPHLHLGFRL